MESNIAYNLESKLIEYVLEYFIVVHISDLTMFISYAPPTSASLFWFYYNYTPHVVQCLYRQLTITCTTFGKRVD